jgi:putative transposase
MLVVAKDLQTHYEMALDYASRTRWRMRRARQSMRCSPGIIPKTFVRIEPTVSQKPWVAPVLQDGRRTALRYLAAYLKKSAFGEGRLLDCDQSGRIMLSYRNSADGKLRSEAVDPLKLIRR